MDLFNKVKLFFIDKQDEKIEKDEEIIKIEELPSRIERKINEINELKNKFKDVLMKRISLFELDINDRLIILRDIDLSQRKEYENIKIIVEDNLATYISCLQRMVEKIKYIENKELEEYIRNLFFVLNEFRKVSSSPFEKATILIGEDLGQTREIIKIFIQDLNNLVEENVLIFDKSKKCEHISNLLSLYQHLNSSHLEIKCKLLEINSLLENTVKEETVLKNKLLEIKEGEDFKKNNLDKIKYKDKLDSLEKKVQIMKGKLDLKSLLKEFHHDKNIDCLIRAYLKDFKNALTNDKDLKISKIIKENVLLSQLKETQENAMYMGNANSLSEVDKEITLLEERIKEKNIQAIGFKEDIRNEEKRKEKILMKLQRINSDLMEYSKQLFR